MLKRRIFAYFEKEKKSISISWGRQFGIAMHLERANKLFCSFWFTSQGCGRSKRVEWEEKNYWAIIIFFDFPTLLFFLRHHFLPVDRFNIQAWCITKFRFRFDWLILNVTPEQNYDTVDVIATVHKYKWYAFFLLTRATNRFIVDLVFLQPVSTNSMFYSWSVWLQRTARKQFINNFKEEKKIVFRFTWIIKQRIFFSLLDSE